MTYIQVLNSIKRNRSRFKSGTLQSCIIFILFFEKYIKGDIIIKVIILNYY